MPRFKLGPQQADFNYGRPVDPTVPATDADVLLTGIGVIGGVPTVDLTVVPFDPAHQAAPSRMHAVFSDTKIDPAADGAALEAWTTDPAHFAGQADVTPDPVNGTKVIIGVPTLPPIKSYQYATILEYAV